MNTNTTILATALLLTPMLACDTMEEHEPLIAMELRADPSEFWEEVICIATTCYGLHPSTSDAWVRLELWSDIEAKVKLGRLKLDVTGGYGPFSCAPGKFPDMFPTTNCYRLVGSTNNVCYGGGSTLAVKVVPSCNPPLGYTEEHYLAVGCTTELGDAEETVDLFAHATQVESGLLFEGNGAMLIAPACHFTP